MRCSARLAVTLLGACLLAPFALGARATGAAASTWQPPGYVRSIGGTGTAGVYAWGIAYNAATSQVEVSDYWNFFVRSYSTTGQQTAAFYQSASTRQGQPESLAVDPSNGDIYVAENGTQKAAGYIARFDKSGTYIAEINTRSQYTAWIAVDNFHHLFVVNGHLSGSTSNPNKVQEYDLTQASYPQIRSWGTYGSGPGGFLQAMGLATDSSGNVYVADAGNQRVSEFSPTGAWIRDFGSAGTGVGQFSGDLRGVAIDQANSWVYVSDAAGYQIEKFDTSGHPVTHWGSQGSGPGQFADGARQIAVDSSGNLWAADYGNQRFEEFTSTGTFMAVYPAPAEPPAPGFLSEVRDVAVNPTDGTVWAADSWSNRFQKFGSDGTFQGTWGGRGSKPPYGLDYPRGIGADPSTGNVWVADTRDFVIRIYDSKGNYLTTIGTGLNSNQPGSFQAPVDVQFYAGYAYVGDYWSCTMTVWNATTYQYSRQINGCNNGVAVDPLTGNTYIVDWNAVQVREYSPSCIGSCSPIRTWGGKGTGSGQFLTPWGIDVNNGVVYVTDAKRNNVQAFDLSGNYLGQWGGTGSGAFQFNQPSGIAHDAAGNIYVASANQGRIQVFSESVPVPSGDTTPPAVAMTSPTANQVVPAATVTISGTATDNVGLGDLEVAVHNSATNLWWDGGHSAWVNARIWNFAAPVCNSLTSCSFTFAFVGETYSGTYGAQVRALDTTGTATMSGTVVFTVSST